MKRLFLAVVAGMIALAIVALMPTAHGQQSTLGGGFRNITTNNFDPNTFTVTGGTNVTGASGALWTNIVVKASSTSNAVTIPLGTITADTKAISSTATWNNAGVNFVHKLTSITASAAGASSLIEDWQVGGASKFKVDYTGVGTFAGNVSAANFVGAQYTDASSAFRLGSTVAALATAAEVGSLGGLYNRSAGGVLWSSTSSYAGTVDTGLARNGAGIVEINNGTAGTLRDLTARNLTANSAAGTVPLTVNGAASQTADLLLIQNSAGTDLVNVGSAGDLKTIGHAAFAVEAVNLLADNTAVATTNRFLITLSSDSTTATDRTFTLATGVTGQTLKIVWTHATNRGEMADTGIQKLSAAWSPDQDDTISLVFDGTNWYETSRSAN